jgi:hypothetical protein
MYSENKDKQYEQERAEIVALGCFSSYEELERCNKGDERKERFKKFT